MSPLSSPLPGIAEAGGDTNPRAVGQHSKVRFKMLMRLASLPVMHWRTSSLSSATSALRRHSLFSPTFSARWMRSRRSGVPEIFYPEALTRGLREVSKDGDMWGNIYPRAGALSQTHDYKTGAVIAQRAADLVTRNGQPHVYIPLAASSHDGYWPPDPVTEGDSNNHQWQMLVPKNPPPARSSRMDPPPILTPINWRKMARMSGRCGGPTNAARVVGRPFLAVAEVNHAPGILSFIRRLSRSGG